MILEEGPRLGTRRSIEDNEARGVQHPHRGPPCQIVVFGDQDYHLPLEPFSRLGSPRGGALRSLAFTGGIHVPEPARFVALAYAIRTH